MLKIKDNVDLKELEKFGFIYIEELGYDGNLFSYWNGGECVCVDTDDRKIDEMGLGYSNKDVDTLYDLIKADLVEKVDE